MGRVNGVGITRINTPKAPATTTIRPWRASCTAVAQRKRALPVWWSNFCGRSVSATLVSSPLMGLARCDACKGLCGCLCLDWYRTLPGKCQIIVTACMVTLTLICRGVAVTFTTAVAGAAARIALPPL